LPPSENNPTGNTLEYAAAARKRWPLGLRIALASAVLCLAAAILLNTWAGRVYYAGAPLNGYGGFVEYLRVRHTPTATGVARTYTLHRGHFAICWAISLPIVVASVWSTRRLLGKG
jgi:hypothetical protein